MNPDQASSQKRRPLAALAPACLAAALMAISTSPVSAQTGEGAYCTTQEFSAYLETLRPVDGRIKLDVTPHSKTWKIGESASFSVTSPFAGELLLMSLDAKGIALPIFPNGQFTASDSARIEADTTLTLPRPDQGFAFEVQGPVGPSRLIAIVRPEGRQLPLPCARPLTKGVPIDVRDGADGSTAAAAPAVPKIYEGWGYAAFDYEVVAKE